MYIIHLIPRHPAGRVQVQGRRFADAEDRVLRQRDQLGRDEVPAQVGPQRVRQVVEELSLFFLGGVLMGFCWLGWVGV